MPHGKAVSEDIQWVIVRLGTAMSCQDIAMYTDLSERKVRDTLSHFKQNGDVNVPKRQRPNLHRSLQDESIQVRFEIILYLFCLTILNTSRSIYSKRSAARQIYI